jgi:hypothetical protein
LQGRRRKQIRWKTRWRAPSDHDKHEHNVTLTERANHVLNSYHFGDYDMLRSLQS